MGWEQLAGMYQRAKQLDAEEESTAPVDCPNDGTTLETGPHGELHCKFDGWIWDGTPLKFSK